MLSWSSKKRKVAPFKVVAKQTFEELTADEDRLLLITTSLLLVLLLLVVGLLVVVVLLLLFDGSAVVVVVVSSLSPLLSDDVGGGDGGWGEVSTSTLTTLKEMSGSRELGSMRYSSWRGRGNDDNGDEFALLFEFLPSSSHCPP